MSLLFGFADSHFNAVGSGHNSRNFDKFYYRAFSFPCKTYIEAYLNCWSFFFLQVDGKEVLKFAQCYGFRNLQNIVSKVKRGKCEYHFVEVMACPSGISWEYQS